MKKVSFWVKSDRGVRKQLMWQAGVAHDLLVALSTNQWLEKTTHIQLKRSSHLNNTHGHITSPSTNAMPPRKKNASQLVGINRVKKSANFRIVFGMLWQSLHIQQPEQKTHLFRISYRYWQQPKYIWASLGALVLAPATCCSALLIVLLLLSVFIQWIKNYQKAYMLFGSAHYSGHSSSAFNTPSGSEITQRNMNSLAAYPTQDGSQQQNHHAAN